MKKLLFLLFGLPTLLLAQVENPVFPPASLNDLLYGSNKYSFVSPYTLSHYIHSTNQTTYTNYTSVTQTNVIITNLVNGQTTSNLTVLGSFTATVLPGSVQNPPWLNTNGLPQSVGGDVKFFGDVTIDNDAEFDINGVSYLNYLSSYVQDQGSFLYMDSGGALNASTNPTFGAFTAWWPTRNTGGGGSATNAIANANGSGTNTSFYDASATTSFLLVTNEAEIGGPTNWLELGFVVDAANIGNFRWMNSDNPLGYFFNMQYWPHHGNSIDLNCPEMVFDAAAGNECHYFESIQWGYPSSSVTPYEWWSNGNTPYVKGGVTNWNVRDSQGLWQWRLLMTTNNWANSFYAGSGSTSDHTQPSFLARADDDNSGAALLEWYASFDNTPVGTGTNMHRNYDTARLGMQLKLPLGTNLPTLTIPGTVNATAFVGDGSGLTGVSGSGSGISTNGGTGTNNIFTKPTIVDGLYSFSGNVTSTVPGTLTLIGPNYTNTSDANGNFTSPASANYGGTVTAAGGFSGPGTSLTGTAASLTAGLVSSISGNSLTLNQVTNPFSANPTLHVSIDGVAGGVAASNVTSGGQIPIGTLFDYTTNEAGGYLLETSGSPASRHRTFDAESLTNLISTNISSRAVYATNLTSGVVVDATIPYQNFATNADMTVTGFSGLVSGYRYVLSVFYLNSDTGPHVWTAPPYCHFPTNGVSTNVMTIPAGQEMGVSWEIRPGLRTNMVNLLIP